MCKLSLSSELTSLIKLARNAARKRYAGTDEGKLRFQRERELKDEHCKTQGITDGPSKKAAKRGNTAHAARVTQGNEASTSTSSVASTATSESNTVDTLAGQQNAGMSQLQNRANTIIPQPSLVVRSPAVSGSSGFVDTTRAI